MERLEIYGKVNTSNDLELRERAMAGERDALEQLIDKHRDFIYNVVWRMVLNPVDAEDITQDIIVKIITNLASFRGLCAFRTWLYRIAFNYVLNLKKRPMEDAIINFDQYGQELEQFPDSLYPANRHETPEDLAVIKDVMLGCTAGMLMCLDREQRLIYILSEMFEIDHNLGAEILEISKENFRQKLSRARKQLVNFMKNKCGLINKQNSCRCKKKTKAFIDHGWVDPSALQFNAFYRQSVLEKIPHVAQLMSDTLEKKYATIFRQHPFQERITLKEKFHQLIASPDFRNTFQLH